MQRKKLKKYWIRYERFLTSHQFQFDFIWKLLLQILPAYIAYGVLYVCLYFYHQKSLKSKSSFFYKNSKSRWIAKCTLQPTYTFRFNLIILVFFWTNIGRRKRFCINFLKLNFQSSFTFILSPLGGYKRSHRSLSQHAYWSEKFPKSSGQ